MNNNCCCCLRGPRGFTGETGAQGPRGLQGPVGERGPMGPCGCEGPEGPQGPIGVTGQQGPEGIQGPTGAEGPIGQAGANGADGLTPSIGENGNWWLGTTDTGINAVGPSIAGNYESLINAGEFLQDELLTFPNGGFVQRGMSIDSSRKVITLEKSAYYRITYFGYLYATSGTPHINILKNGEDLNYFTVAENQGGLTVIDIVYPFMANDTLSLVVRNGNVQYWENANNEINGFLTIVGWGLI